MGKHLKVWFHHKLLFWPWSRYSEQNSEYMNIMGNSLKHNKTPLHNLWNFFFLYLTFTTFSMQKLGLFSEDESLFSASEALCSAYSETDCSYLFSPGCHTADDLCALSFFLGKTSLFAQSVLQAFWGVLYNSACCYCTHWACLWLICFLYRDLGRRNIFAKLPSV